MAFNRLLIVWHLELLCKVIELKNGDLAFRTLLNYNGLGGVEGRIYLDGKGRKEAIRFAEQIMMLYFIICGHFDCGLFGVGELARPNDYYDLIANSFADGMEEIILRGWSKKEYPENVQN